MNAYDVILRPVVTERAMDDLADKKYTFKVMKTANKTEVKKAVETIFGVEVEKVTIMNMTGKKKRQGMTEGKTSDWKKAIVKLTPESKTIEFFESLE